MGCLLLGTPPEQIAVQGQLHSAAGLAVDGVYKVAAALYDQPSGGKVLWETNIEDLQVTAGVFDVVLDGVAATVFLGDGVWLGVKIESEPELPRQQILSTPMALVAARALGIECTACVKPTALAAPAGDCGAGGLLVWSGDAWTCGAGPDLSGFATVEALAAYAKTADLAPYAKTADLAPFAKTADLAEVATSGAYGDLSDAPTLAKLGASCPDNTFMTGILADGTYQCQSATPDGLLAVPVAAADPKPCTPALLGATYVNSQDKALYVCNGADYVVVTNLDTTGTQPNPGTSCKQLLTALSSPKDGIYWISIAGGAATQVYCDMTTDGGGWTLVSYGYRPTSGGTAVYYLPTSAQGPWSPQTRDDRAAIDAKALVAKSTHFALTITTGGAAPVTGNLQSYTQVYRWAIPAPATDGFGLVSGCSGCTTVQVTELKANSTFAAKTLPGKPQVTCTGNKAGTPYERQFIGFNSTGCCGACGWDPVTSNGMVVWHGSGYNPTTSAGTGNAERAGSFGFWMR